jgi:hypothetical protein
VPFVIEKADILPDNICERLEPQFLSQRFTASTEHIGRGKEADGVKKPDKQEHARPQPGVIRHLIHWLAEYLKEDAEVLRIQMDLPV